MDYKAPDNIYWLFSSSAQAIAAFTGFLSAGFFFVYDKIDKQVEKDETLEEIYADIKKQYYTRLKVLFILTGLSIGLSLAVVYINGYDLGYAGAVIKWLVALLNILTIYWAIWFVIFIIDPDKVKRTTQKLIEENKEVFAPQSGTTLPRTQYLGKFAELESQLRNIADRYKIVRDRRGRFGDYSSVGEIARALYQRGALTGQQLREISEASKVRNLAEHGSIQNIESRQGRLVDNLISQLKQIQ